MAEKKPKHFRAKRMPTLQLPKQKKLGRPLASITYDQVRDLAALQCTIDEMAHVLKVNRDTIYARFSDALEEGRAQGNISIRRKMFWRAMEAFNGTGDTQMLIWLSKQYLGHKDRSQDEVLSINFNVSVNEVPQ